MPNPTIENQIKIHMINRGLLNKDYLKKSKFFEYTTEYAESGKYVNFDLETFDLNKSPTFGLQIDDSLLMDGITLWREEEFEPDDDFYERVYGRIKINNKIYILVIEEIVS